MNKGTVVIVVPEGSHINPADVRQWEFPVGFSEYLDGRINVVYLPEGGVFGIGKRGKELMDAVK